MIVELPYFGNPCKIPCPIILKVKNPLILKVNEGVSSYRYFIKGTITDYEHSCNRVYKVDIPDATFVEGTQQLHVKDFDKWSTDLVLIEYIDEQTKASGMTYVVTDDSLQGTGLDSAPLGVAFDIIDGQH